MVPLRCPFLCEVDAKACGLGLALFHWIIQVTKRLNELFGTWDHSLLEGLLWYYTARRSGSLRLFDEEQSAIRRRLCSLHRLLRLEGQLWIKIEATNNWPWTRVSQVLFWNLVSSSQSRRSGLICMMISDRFCSSAILSPCRRDHKSWPSKTFGGRVWHFAAESMVGRTSDTWDKSFS